MTVYTSQMQEASTWEMNLQAYVRALNTSLAFVSFCHCQTLKCLSFLGLFNVFNLFKVS